MRQHSLLGIKLARGALPSLASFCRTWRYARVALDGAGDRKRAAKAACNLASHLPHPPT